MKKKSLKSLELKKEVISNLQKQNITGGIEKTELTAGKRCMSNIQKCNQLQQY
jgi:hypothetical protein